MPLVTSLSEHARIVAPNSEGFDHAVTADGTAPRPRKPAIAGHLIGPLLSGNSIKPRRSPREIQFINFALVPETRSGEQPIPASGVIALRRFNSLVNQSAQSGTTGSPKRSERR